MKRETRTGEVGNVKPDGTYEVLAVVYNVVDDYGSVWAPGCFERSAAERLPVVAWAHDWAEPIGRALGYRTTDEGAYFTARLDIGGNVPRADQAFQQISPGPNGEAPTLTDVSVGFVVPEGGRRTPTDEERKRWPGAKEVIEEATLDEFSHVLRGAVPGASVLAGSVRDARGNVVPEAELIKLAKRVAAEELTVDEAKAALAILATDDEAPPPPDGGEPPPDDSPPPLDDLAAAVIAEAEQIIDDDRSR